MQRMQRKVGAFLPRTADDSQVAMLIADFEAADKMLETLIDASKHWRDSWNDILLRQTAMLSDYENIYSSIVGADGNETGKYSNTPQDTLERVNALKVSYTELKNEMLDEIALVEKQIINPAKDARTSVKTYKKVIKKREDRKLDYERYKGRTEKSQSNTKRTDRENTALAKHQIDLSTATAAYEAADDELKKTLPGMTHATYSLLPHLLNAQIMIQNTLLAQLYTVLHNYASDYGFPSPPPEADDIMRTFESEFTSLRLEAESGIDMLAKGKAIHQPMSLEQKGKSYSGLNLRNKVEARRHPNQAPTSTALTRPLPPAEDDTASSPATPPLINSSSRPRIPSSNSYSQHLSPTYSNSTPPSTSHQPDYFAPASHSSSLTVRRPSAVSLVSNTSMSSIAAKKKPPPPPPPKKKPSQQFEYVVALYDFQGQGAGDLSFSEGDKIRIIKKTASANDWWEGELRGVKGSFPANYCQ